MSKPVIYGISASRAFRSLWAIEEVGVEFDHVPTSFRGDAQEPDYLAVNPNGRIPALVDGDLKLFESMAINLYLAGKYQPGLLSAPSLSDEAAQALIHQWSVWAISEIEPLQMQIVVQKFFTPEDKRNEKVIAGATKGLQRPLKVLETQLSANDYLLGTTFTLADLNLAGVMDLLSMLEFDLSEYPAVSRWLAACYGRASFARAKALA